MLDEAKKVKAALEAHGLETPRRASGLSTEEKLQQLTGLFTEVAKTLDLDLADDSLCGTPRRIAKMYVQEIFSGLDYENFPKITIIDNKMGTDEMIMVKDISLTSTCEHHFITIDGMAKVAYLPENKIIGLSKINRIVRFFAQRPQVQERLTQQLLIALQTLLETKNVAVSIEATHFCVKARGVMDATSATRTTALGGSFKANITTRSEFLAG